MLSCVTSFSWLNELKELVKRVVPVESRSAFVVRAIMRQLATKEWTGQSEFEWTPTSTEAFGRGWLSGVVFGASADRRDYVDLCDHLYDASELVLMLTYNDERRVGKDEAAQSVPPVVFGGREWVRRPQTIGRGQSVPGSSTFSVRMPEVTVEAFHKSVPENRSAFAAGAVESELAIATVGDVRLKRTEEVIWAFARGCVAGQSRGHSLVADIELGEEHIEDLVDREIRAYLLEPRRGRRR